MFRYFYAYWYLLKAKIRFQFGDGSHHIEFIPGPRLGAAMDKIARQYLIHNSEILPVSRSHFSEVPYDMNKLAFELEAEFRPNGYLTIRPALTMHLPDHRNWMIFVFRETPFVYMKDKDNTVRLLRFGEFTDFWGDWYVFQDSESFYPMWLGTT